MFFNTALFTTLLALAPTPGTAISQITRTGKYLYDDSGERFYIKGVAYQPQGEVGPSSEINDANGGFPEPSSYIDPLSSSTNCTRDLPYLQELGANAIRVYSVDPDKDHTECMQTFSDAGIYVLLDISLPLNGSINRASPAWTTSLLNEYIRTIDAFAAYDNILAFNIGNEVINVAANTDAGPFVKAAARDVKAYLRANNIDALVGYSSVDGEPAFRDPLANYLTCGDETISLDLFGLNNYEWCGNNTFAESGWESIVDDFSNLPVAAYMSEYGCISSPPRLWQEVGSLYSAPTTDVFSGGIAFSYFPTSDGYGMVTFGGPDGQDVDTSDDFNRLANQLSNVTSTPNTPAQSAAQVTQGECPSAENSTFQASNTLPDTPDEAVCNCLYENSFSCVVEQETARKPAVMGALLDYTCSLLGSTNSTASCTTIGGNGTTGEYGELQYCSDAIKLSYVFSAYYESQNRRADACNFAGNATAVPRPPNTPEDASTAASQCLAQGPQGGVFTVTSGGATRTAHSTDSMGTATTTAGAGQPTSSDSNTGGAQNAAMSLDPARVGGILALVGAIAFGVVLM